MTCDKWYTLQTVKMLEINFTPGQSDKCKIWCSICIPGVKLLKNNPCDYSWKNELQSQTMPPNV